MAYLGFSTIASSCPRPSSPLLLLFFFAALFTTVYAQQPVSDIGTWPPGAATLLVGLWLGSQAIMAQDYDCVPPAFLVRLLRLFPTQPLTKNWMGNGVKSLVLSQSRQPKQPKPTANSAWTDQGGFLEWDVLTVYNDLDMNDGT